MDDQNKKGNASTKQKQQKTSTKTKNSPAWIAALQNHADEGKTWVTVSGFDGGETEDSLLRLYLDSSLSTAIDIPKDAILHAEPAQGGLSGGKHLWIDSSHWGECLYRQRG